MQSYSSLITQQAGPKTRLTTDKMLPKPKSVPNWKHLLLPSFPAFCLTRGAYQAGSATAWQQLKHGQKWDEKQHTDGVRMRRGELGFNQGVSFQRPLPRSSLQLQPQRTVSAHSAPSFLGQCCVCLFSWRVICRICYKNFLAWDPHWGLGLRWELRGYFVLLKVCKQSCFFFFFKLSMREYLPCVSPFV